MAGGCFDEVNCKSKLFMELMCLKEWKIVEFSFLIKIQKKSLNSHKVTTATDGGKGKSFKRSVNKHFFHQLDDFFSFHLNSRHRLMKTPEMCLQYKHNIMRAYERWWKASSEEKKDEKKRKSSQVQTENWNNIFITFCCIQRGKMKKKCK